MDLRYFCCIKEEYVCTSDDHDLVLDKSDCKATVGEHYEMKDSVMVIRE